MLTFKDLQDEVSRRGQRNKGGTTFTEAIKNLINTSLFRLSREAKWRVMRRRSKITTINLYSQASGSGVFTEGSSSIAIPGAQFVSSGVAIGRRAKLSGDGTFHTINQIIGESGATINENYGGSNTAVGTYSILGQEEYILPIQAGHRVFLWHEEWGTPYVMNYVPDQDFYASGVHITEENIPTHYRMWSEDMVIEQLLEPSVVTVSSTASGDTSIDITVFGVVSGFPDFETITTNSTNGTTAQAGSKVFTSVERVVKSASSTGRITATANSANTTVAVMPVGDTTGGIFYKKIQIWPLPSTIFDINVMYYKDPYRLVNDGDIHEMGQDFDEAIILLATAKLKYEDNQTEGDKFFGLYTDEKNNLRKTNVDKIDFLPSLQRPSQARRGPQRVHRFLRTSQAGSHFGLPGR